MPRLPLALLAVLIGAPAAAQPEDWSRPFPGHRVIGNLYAVGTHGLGCFLITSEEGHILINTGLVDSTPLIRENIESLGFRLEHVRILLTMQAHYDHAAAFAETFRRQDAMEVDIWVAAHGQQYGLHEKHRPGDPYDPDRFVDPEGFRKLVAHHEKLYEEQLAAERR